MSDKVKYYKITGDEKVHQDIMNMGTIYNGVRVTTIFDKDHDCKNVDEIRSLYVDCIQQEAEYYFDDPVENIEAEREKHTEYIDQTLQNLEPILHDRWYCHNIKNDEHVEEEKSEVWSVVLNLINNENIERDQNIKIRSWVDNEEKIKPLSNISCIDDGLSVLIE